MSSNIRQTAHRVFVVVAVLALLTQPAIATAAASSTTMSSAQSPDCDEGMYRYLYFAGGIETSEYCDDPQRPDVSRADWHLSALAALDTQKAATTAASNSLNDSRTYVRTLIKKEVVEGLRNNKTVNETKAAVNASIRDYYSTYLHNLVNSYRSQVNTVTYLGNRTAWDDGNENQIVYGAPGFMEPDSTDSQPMPWEGLGYDYAWVGAGTYTFGHDKTANATLPDNTTVEYPVIYVVKNGATFDDPAAPFNPKMGVTNRSDFESTYEGNEFWFLVASQDPANGTITDADTGQYPGNLTVVLNTKEYWSEWDRTHQVMNDMMVRGANYTEQVYATYNASSFDSTEILDANTLATQYSTDYNSTGYYGWVAAEMGLTGLNGSVNQSFSIHYDPVEQRCTYDGGLNGSNTTKSCEPLPDKNMTGTLFTDWSPSSTNGSFERGATYDTANADAAVYFINQTTANSSEMVRLNGTFTIEELRNTQTGEEVNATTLEQQTRQTFNASLTKEQMEALVEYDMKVEGAYSSDDETTSGWPDFNVDPMTAGILVLVALGAVALFGGSLGKAS